MATSSICFSLTLLLLCHVSLAQFGFGGSHGRRLGSRSQCRIERLSAQEPRRRIEAEAGMTEYFDDNDDKQFDCAGVSALRRTVQPNGLVLPFFSNSPVLVYVLQGKGMMGTIFPGCPETYQSFERQSEFRDQHQRIHHFREGDIIAIPAGVSHWCYNDGESPLVTLNVMDTSNEANQLDRQHREFLLAGSQKSTESESERNVLSGFETKIMAEAIGVRQEVVEKMQGKKDSRGNIVKVKGDFQVLRPSGEREDEESDANGLEQSVCSMRIKENIRTPTRADVYNPNAGRFTNLNSQKLPILKYLRLSAEWGKLKRVSQK